MVPGVRPVSVERFDPTSDAWFVVAEMPEPREGPLGTRLADGTVLIVGGLHDVGTGSDATRDWAADAYRYRPGPTPRG